MSTTRGGRHWQLRPEVHRAADLSRCIFIRCVPAVGPSTIEAKNAARRLAKQRRIEAANPQDEKLATNNLEQLLDGYPADAGISGYLPIGTELSPVAVMRHLCNRGRIICVPVVDKPGHPLRFRRWSPSARLVISSHGVPVPAAGNWEFPGILIVPLLAFDHAGFRLGYGGGYYDRTLEILRRGGPTTAIGLAYCRQQIERVPREAFDQPLDMVVTERGIVSFADTFPN